MDALLSSLRALSLLPPSPSQLLQLLSSPGSAEEEEKDIRDLARVLSLGSYDPDQIDEDGDDAAAGAGASSFGIDRELIEDGVVEMIRSFRKEVAKMRSAYEAEEKQRQSPIPLPAKATPLHFLKLRHDAMLRQTEKLNSLYGGYRPRLIFSGGPSYSSEVELAELKAVTDKKEVSVGGRLAGRYLLARVASPVSIYVGATFLVTLPQPLGFSLPMSVSHFTPSPAMSSAQASQALPEGTILALKEPYISPHHALRAAGSSGSVGIRVDTPTDVVVLSPGHALLEGLEWAAEPKAPAVKGKKAKGAHEEEVEEAKPAEEDATSASASPAPTLWLQDRLRSQRVLQQSDDAQSPDSLLDSVEQLLYAGRPGAAFRELHAASSSTSPSNGDASRLHELRGDALYRMSAWSEAASSYKLASAKDKHAAALQRSREARSGPSSDPSASCTVSSIYFSHLSSPTPRIDVADWLSPSLRVAQIPNAGRGLVTTCPVAAGTPLLMAKSRGSSYPGDCEGNSEGVERCPVLRCDFENGVLSTTTQVLATTKLIHIMIDRPEVAQEILGLTAGPKMRDSRWVEAERFEKAKAPLGDPWVGLEAARTGPKGGINALYVDEVLRHNAFGPGTVRRGGGEDGGEPKASTSKSANGTTNGSSHTTTTAVRLPPSLHRKLHLDPPSAFSRSTQPHPLPAILNHSCLPNVSSVFLGDVVVTRALRDLSPGEEIGHEYVRGVVDYHGRQEGLKKHGFVCRCGLCDLDRGDEETRLGKRRKVFAVKVPAIFSRSDALLRHHRGAADVATADDDREKHEEIRQSLLELEAELKETYDGEKRGKLRPEMRETLERIARHAVCEGRPGLALRYFLRSLESVNAVLWGDYAGSSEEEEEEDDDDAKLSNKMAAQLAVNDEAATCALSQAPALDVDEAQRTLWRISQLFISPALNSPRLSLLWSRTAYWTHDILVGGGYAVFRDRWGPTSQQEEESLEWKEAWRLWDEECGAQAGRGGDGGAGRQ